MRQHEREAGRHLQLSRLTVWPKQDERRGGEEIRRAAECGKLGRDGVGIISRSGSILVAMMKRDGKGKIGAGIHNARESSRRIFACGIAAALSIPPRWRRRRCGEKPGFLDMRC